MPGSLKEGWRGPALRGSGGDARDQRLKRALVKGLEGKGASKGHKQVLGGWQNGTLIFQKVHMEEWPR